MSGFLSERERRWRLILGSSADSCALSGQDTGIDRVLEALYDSERKAGLGSSSPQVARWLGDIRQYFPSPVVQVMQRDALERLNLRQMLLEPEMLAGVEPDVHLVATLLSLKSVLPNRTKETARQVVRKVVDEVMRRLSAQVEQAVTGGLHRSSRNRRPRLSEIDWHRTIRANLRHYQPEYRTVIPETRIGFGRKRSSLRDLVLCVDQSGSMAASVVYAGIFGAVLASLPTVTTRMVVFDTAVVDLSEHLQDPVDLLFGTQLGGGTDINRALAYCQSLVTRPHDTILLLISDLYEGGNAEQMLRRAASLVCSGVQMIALLALSDQGAPAYHRETAAKLASFGIPSFACTPELFPDLLTTVLRRGDVSEWIAHVQADGR